MRAELDLATLEAWAMSGGGGFDRKIIIDYTNKFQLEPCLGLKCLDGLQGYSSFFYEAVIEEPLIALRMMRSVRQFDEEDGIVFYFPNISVRIC